MIGLIIIATGNKYVEYARGLLTSASTHFPEAHTLVFTDQPQRVGVTSRVFFTEPLGYPKQTLHRYRIISEKAHILKDYDHLFYVDADMKFVKNVVLEDIISTGITATLHPGYVGGRGTPETNPDSNAFCDSNSAYYCGGFQGGTSQTYLSVAQELAEKIRLDEENNVMAVWHDESHWNRYLADYPPSKVLGPEYCFPDVNNDYYRDKWRAAGFGEIEPVLLALTKESR